MRHQSSGGQQNLYEADSGAQQSRQHNGKHGGGNRRITRHQELREQEGGGYGSDGSVETLSVNSAQSMQNRLGFGKKIRLKIINNYCRALLRQQQIQRIRDQHQITQQSSNEENDQIRSGQMAIEDEEEAIEFGRSTAREGQSGSGQPMKGMGVSAKELKERKKSLMTRLIPGRNGPNGLAYGIFARTLFY